MTIAKKPQDFALKVWSKAFCFVQDKANQTDASRVAAVSAVTTCLLLLMLFTGPLVLSVIFVLSTAVFFGVRGLLNQMEKESGNE